MSTAGHFEAFFFRATGNQPYDYQTRLANGDDLPELIDVPTGLGKTAAVILAWLWRRRFAASPIRRQTPRRLVHCLPMRTLVEQTRENAVRWLDRLGMLAGSAEWKGDKEETLVAYAPQPGCAKGVAKWAAENGDDGRRIAVHLLMGGNDAGAWDEHPECDAILIGTQDMLLSRALNRGYGMSRYRWPMHFGLLNNDCLWIMDETQLMGVGLTTTAQLQGLRAKLATYGVTHSFWMSATLDTSAIHTVDHTEAQSGWRRLEVGPEDRNSDAVLRLLQAEKPCGPSCVRLTSENAKLADAVNAKKKPRSKSDADASYVGSLADDVLAAHQAATLTLVIVNRVDRAQRLTQSINARKMTAGLALETALVHSRFRPADREETQRQALDERSVPPGGRILVATQAIEAGVDLSATTLFTELAPWSSLVQRFGRCNRRGLCGKEGRAPARVVWIDIDTSADKKAKDLALPYSVDELIAARLLLNPEPSPLGDVGPEALRGINWKQETPVVHTLRRKDLIELWDTTPDLAGNDLDISRFIRDADNSDVQVYWRDWDRTANAGRPPASREGGEQSSRFAAPERRELCSVSIGAIKVFLEKLASQKDVKQKLSAWRWNPLEVQWESVGSKSVRPGMVLLLHAEASGYDAQLGWTGDVKSGRVPVIATFLDMAEESMQDDALGHAPQLLAAHLQRVAAYAKGLRDALVPALPDIPWDAIERAAWWHDVGKAHVAFQTAMRDCKKVVAADKDGKQLWAKSGSKERPRYRVGEQLRRGFRHELASALAWLHQHSDASQANLIAYLIAAHHGKVRLSLRSLPNEAHPADTTLRFARGVWERDKLPMVDVGNGDVSPEFLIDLELMELGESNTGEPSWAARVLNLRDDPQLGPFKLAFLEMLLRVADWRGSASENNE